MRYKIVIDSCGELIERWKEDPSIERASPVSYTHLTQTKKILWMMRALIRHIS